MWKKSALFFLIVIAVTSFSFSPHDNDYKNEKLNEYKKVTVSDIDIEFPLIKEADDVEKKFIYDELIYFWETYIASYAEGSEFEFSTSIFVSNNDIVSIKYEGQVYTASKAIPQAFAFNFSLNTCQLLKLDEINALLPIYKYLDFVQLQNADLYLEENMRYSFEHFHIIDGEAEHLHDFYLENGKLYIIVSTSSALGNYHIVDVSSVVSTL